MQSSRQRQHDTHQHCNDREHDSALRMIRERVENLIAGQDVETDEQDVVGKQHEGTEYIGYLALSKDVISKVTCSHYEIAHSVGPQMCTYRCP